MFTSQKHLTTLLPVYKSFEIRLSESFNQIFTLLMYVSGRYLWQSFFTFVLVEREVNYLSYPLSSKETQPEASEWMLLLLVWFE